MTRNQPATKLPWKDLSPATEMSRTHLRETNLAYAVHAVNAYPKLIAALWSARNATDDTHEHAAIDALLGELGEIE